MFRSNNPPTEERKIAEIKVDAACLTKHVKGTLQAETDWRANGGNDIKLFGTILLRPNSKVWERENIPQRTLHTRQLKKGIRYD